MLSEYTQVIHTSHEGDSTKKRDYMMHKRQATRDTATLLLKKLLDVKKEFPGGR
jgi:hypothetical protein